MIEFLVIGSLILATVTATICGWHMLLKTTAYQNEDEKLPDDEHPALPDLGDDIKWMLISLIWLLAFSTPANSMLMAGVMFLTLMACVNFLQDKE